jgi:hypothetical protein
MAVNLLGWTMPFAKDRLFAPFGIREDNYVGPVWLTTSKKEVSTSSFRDNNSW